LFNGVINPGSDSYPSLGGCGL